MKIEKIHQVSPNCAIKRGKRKTEKNAQQKIARKKKKKNENRKKKEKNEQMPEKALMDVIRTFSNSEHSVYSHYYPLHFLTRKVLTES